MTRSGLLAAGVAAVLATPAGAQTRPGFEVGAEVFDYRYRERVDGATVVRDDGTFVGLTLGYVETLRNGWFLRARGDGAAAEVDYRNDEGAELRNIDQRISRFELGIGRDVALGRATLTPSVAIGGRTLDDDLGGRTASDGTVGYDREIAYVYLPIGLAIGMPAGRARLAVSARYGFIFGGHAKSELSQADPALPDLDLDIDGGHMWELDATVSLPLGRRAITAGPFVRRWSANRSESRVVRFEAVEAEFFEPAARTTEAGLRVTFSF